MIRKANVKDLTYLVNLAVLLWPKHTYEKLEEELRNILNSSRDVVYLYEEGEKAIGFSHCNLRYEYVEGTASKPVAYLEGVFVRDDYRRKGIARKLIRQCEEWAREKKCIEFASDCEYDNIDSMKLHLKMGFNEVNIIRCFKKDL